MKQPKYDWCEPAGVATCTIYYQDQEFLGQAYCHIDDKDMQSKLTGQIIAEARAHIKYLRFVRDHELRPQLKALYQLYYSMKHSQNFNKKSYEAIMLYKQIKSVQKDMDAVKEEIKNAQTFIKDYIDQKENDFKRIREYLNKKQQLAENS